MAPELLLKTTMHKAVALAAVVMLHPVVWVSLGGQAQLGKGIMVDRDTLQVRQEVGPAAGAAVLLL